MEVIDFNKSVQKLLNKLGASPQLVVDGKVGPKTEAALLAEINEIDGEEPDRPSPSEEGKKALWYPLADTSGAAMKAQGTYAKGYPEGAVVHFTAGRCDTEKDMVGSMDWGVKQGYAFFGIGPTGKVYQRLPLNKWGHHAGTSSWPGLGSSLSKRLVGIEIACAGKVAESGKAWFGQKFDASRLRKVATKDNVQGGTYVKYTEEQEESLVRLLLWLKDNNPEVFKLENVLGHDEIAPTRKDDPGGSLSMSMPEFRKLLTKG